MEAIDGRTAHRLFMTICQFPAMRASWLREIVGGSSGEVSRHLKRFVDTGLVAVFDGRHYLSELGMRRAANMSRVLPAIIRITHEGQPLQHHKGAHHRADQRGQTGGQHGSLKKGVLQRHGNNLQHCFSLTSVPALYFRRCTSSCPGK